MVANRFTRPTRREFLRGSVAMGLVAAAPQIVPASALGLEGKPAPGNRVAVGFLGAGGRMNALVNEFQALPDVQPMAVADPRDTPRAALVKRLKLADGNSYRDFRDLVARKDIDAVVIATPDHWHVLLSIAAVQAGKDVYCEKPLCNTIAEGRALVNVVQRYGAVFQHGTQLHSLGEVRHACELVRNGRIGRLKQIRIGSPPGKATGFPPPDPVPADIDYDLWQGPAPLAPYHKEVVNATGWYFISDYSRSGWIAGYGVHDLDIAQWGMGVETSGPVEIQGQGVFPSDGLYDTVLTYDLEFTYANGLKILMTDTGKNRHGVLFEGEEGWVFTRYMIEASPKSLLAEKFRPEEVHLYRSPGHARNFIDCVKTRATTITPAEIAHRSTSTGLLGGIALKLGRKLR